MLAALVWLMAAPTLAQTVTAVGVPGKGEGSVSLTYQHIVIRERTVPDAFGGGFEEFGEITLRTGYLEVDYGVAERLALTLTLPFKSNRYRGDFPHDPRLLLDDRGERFLDDGEFHSNWGDWGVALRYQWREAPVAVTPFVAFYLPSHDYPLFTETQAGTSQWRFDIGVNAGGRIGASNAYWQAGYAFSWMEKTRPRGAPDRRVNHSRLSLEVGYLLSPEWTLRGSLAYLKTHDGLRFPEEFNLPPVDDLWFHHDQLLPWGQTTWAIGADYRFGDRYALSASYGQSLHVQFGHKYDAAWTLSLSRSF